MGLLRWARSRLDTPGRITTGSMVSSSVSDPLWRGTTSHSQASWNPPPRRLVPWFRYWRVSVMGVISNLPFDGLRRASLAKATSMIGRFGAVLPP
jgi:hypothetical protein